MSLSLPRSAILGALIALVGLAFCFLVFPRWTSEPSAPPEAAMPRYQHIFVIIAENKGYRLLMEHPEWAPVLHSLAAQYGTATNFYSEVHPSEGNYVAILGGDTFRIHDDDAFYCRKGLTDPACPNSDQSDYADHDVGARSLMDQLQEKGLSWKAYMEDFPSRAPLSLVWPGPEEPSAGLPPGLYASKHNGFLNFRNVNRQPAQELVRHFAGLDQLTRDLSTNNVPNYAQLVPNQCNDMHGLSGENVSGDCDQSNLPALIRRGDAKIGMLVNQITRSKIWSEPANAAIVITFDESDGSELSGEAQGCCGADEGHEPGGGHILTIVITNHGPRHLADGAAYNHYSLLRSTEAAFGIDEYLGRAANSSQGVVAMTPLFAVSRRSR